MLRGLAAIRVARLLDWIDQAGLSDVLAVTASGINPQNGKPFAYGTTDRAVALARLDADTRFTPKGIAPLHEDIGKIRVEYRSYNGEFGKGSLQVVIALDTDRWYADIDKHNGRQDLYRFVRHNVEEVLGEKVVRFFGKIFRRKRKEQV